MSHKIRMNLVILLIFVTSTTASAPYCVYSTTKATFLKEYIDYTCQIDIDDQLDVLDEIWGQREPDDNKKDKDVKILTVLRRSKSLMTIFPPIFCEHYPNIEVIDMGDAEISEVKLNSLKNCKNLEVVKFYRNQLSEVDENFLKSNRKLKEVYLNYNNFNTFPEDLFRNQQDLEILDISANVINYLPDNIFSSLESLKILNLEVNKLSDLNPNWFSSLENLQELDLSSNQISELPENVFSNLRSLKTLKMDSNSLQTISSHSFDHHPHLEVVILSENKINSIDQRFIENNNIKTMNMKGNQCNNDVRINQKAMSRKLSQCYQNYESIYGTTTTTSTTTRRTTTTTRTRPTTTTTTTRKTTTTTTEPTTTTTTKRTTTTRRTTAPRRTTTSRITTTTMAFKPVTIPSRTRIDEDGCGLRPNGVPLIIEGFDFEPGSYPWMAELIVDSKLHCGGVLISRAKVITAGHCIYTKALRTVDSKEITVVLGGHNFNLLHEVDRLSFAVREIYVHPNWNQYKSSFDSDIAVLMLSEDVTYNAHIHPICVAQPESSAMRVKDGTIVGYGKVDKSEDFTKIPKQASAPIHNLNDCLRKFPNIQPISHHTTFCGGFANGTGACTGDSGGGLFITVGKKFYLRGIVSASLSGDEYGCDVHTYSLFTDVTKFIPWMDEVGRDSVVTRSNGEPERFVSPWATSTQDGIPIFA